MRTERLTIRPEGGARETAQTLTLDPAFGVMGDCKSAKDGQLSLASAEAERAARASGGLCAARFAANVSTSGLDYAILFAGTRLRIGSCEVEIVRVGKRCFDECPLVQAQTRCPLPKSCAFARVTRGGTVTAGDAIRLMDTESTEF